jgi:dUTP pyrophosphatase
MRLRSSTSVAAVKTVKLLIKRSPGTNDLELPAYKSQGAAGLDLCADVPSDVVLSPGEIRLVSTGISVHIPEGYEGQVRPRSGLSLKHGVTLVNTPGTIDSDYRGVVGLPVINLGREPFTIKRGMRLAQMVIQQVVRAEIECVESLEETARSSGGFGHTGA